ncbi:MAG: hypothetical protein MZU79_04705 [Anaerotruncus sp.]|nr:hypothetical protein [Anaerotruncus sp.]
MKPPLPDRGGRRDRLPRPRPPQGARLRPGEDRLPARRGRRLPGHEGPRLPLRFMAAFYARSPEEEKELADRAKAIAELGEPPGDQGRHLQQGHDPQAPPGPGPR